MKRVAAAILGLVLTAIAATVLAACGGSSGNAGGGSFRVDAIFDDAKGIINGQLVEVAGAKVGSIQGVDLTPNYQARIEMKFPSQFAPFHQNASCEIKPEGLIAENYVDCDPGTPNSPPLRGTGGSPPTVPVGHDTEPVAITDLFNIWATPTADRLTVLINELGAGFAGRGGDLNAILERANPALRLANQAIALVNHQRTELADSVAATGAVVAQLAKRSPQVQDFIDRAATVARTTAAHSSNLSLDIQRLPALLNAAKPALKELDSFAAAGTPLLESLRAAAPSVNRVVDELTPFSQAGVPALNALTPVLSRANTTLTQASPLVNQLEGFVSAADPTSETLKDLLVNMRNSGFVENLLGFSYNVASAAAPYDGISHVLPASLLLNGCIGFSTAPVAGCSAWYPNGAQRTVTVAGHTQQKTAPTTTPTQSSTSPSKPSSSGSAGTPAAPVSAVTQPIQSIVQSVTGAVQGAGAQAQNLVGQLLSGVQSLLGGGSSSNSGGNRSSGSADNGNSVKLLLNYLLK
ncbi:MAG TPA: MlaD family protein [Solirubrobacteraceae bacterium]|nr:MlaD family protein [Solirubrobacteraceae bacterium]